MKTKLLCLLLLSLVFYLAALEMPPVSAAPQISVSITGYVKYPGTYYMLPTDRLSNLMEKAMQDPKAALSPEKEIPILEPDLHQRLNPIPSLRHPEAKLQNYEKYQSLRQIMLKRGQSEEIYDLLRFYRLGELEENPALKDGDIFHAGIVESFVSIEGAVAFTGEIEYCEEDTLEDLLRLAQGTLPEANLSSIRIMRYHEDNSAEQIQINLSAQPRLYFSPLQPRDRIMIPFDARYRSKKTVTLSGEFKSTGEFQVEENATLWDIILQAGGITDNADLANAVHLNQDYNAEPNAEFERLKLRSMHELTPLEYSYMRTIMRQIKGRYSVDFIQLFESEGKENNRKLNNHDHIYIPEKLDVVWVSGQVRKPGLVAYKAGENWKYYIEQAGGYSANNALSRGVRVLRSNGGNWVKPSGKQVLMPGDIVFVPDKIDRHFWTDVKDIVTVAASAITILIGVQNLRNK